MQYCYSSGEKKNPTKLNKQQILLTEFFFSGLPRVFGQFAAIQEGSYTNFSHCYVESHQKLLPYSYLRAMFEKLAPSQQR